MSAVSNWDARCCDPISDDLRGAGAAQTRTTLAGIRGWASLSCAQGDWRCPMVGAITPIRFPRTVQRARRVQGRLDYFYARARLEMIQRRSRFLADRASENELIDC